MRDITVDNITEAVQAAWAKTPNERLKFLLQKMVPYLHDYVREVQLTHDEWLAAVQFLWQAGQISDDKRNEFSLLSDVLGVTSLVDLINATPGATIGSVLGPFYVEDSPEIPFGADLVKDNAGEAVLLTGTVRGVDGQPLKGASVDMWQTDTEGFYATQDARQADDNLRCKQACDAEGRYAFTTVLPAPYTIPMDGPVGALFKTTGRTPWRPAHYHFIVRAPGHHPIVTEIFFDHDKLVDNDAVFGVRGPLVRHVDPAGTVGFPTARKPDRRLDYDFTLAPVSESHRPAAVAG
jgi:hydroxyquinol 1,2-dioxygenase